jgi:hypothetical protein
MENNGKLKAYIRYDGSGRIIPGSLILNRFKPKVGNWKETPSNECCVQNCAVPVVIEDWIVDSIVETVEGITFSVLTNSFTQFSMQIQVYSCELDQGIGEIGTINQSNDYQLEFFVPIATFEQGCTFRVRQICPTGGYSQWYVQF